MKNHDIRTQKFSDILTVYLGDTPIEEWLHGVGKCIIMPHLLHGCELIMKGKSETKLCVILISEINFRTFNYHISVKRKSISDTLDKIMKYSLENEEYLMCARIEKLRNSNGN